MKKIDKNNLNEFLNYYHNLHDSNIIKVNYDIEKEQIEILINIYWSGEPQLNEKNCYNTNKKKLKMIFKKVTQCNNKEWFIWDCIYDVYLKYIMLNGKEYICFASEEEDPYLYIVCENIEYEEL